MTEKGFCVSCARPRTSPGRSWSWTAASWPPDGSIVVSLRTLLAVTLLAVGCTVAGPTAPPTATVALASLEGTSWLTEDIDGAGVVDRVQATLIFDAGQKVAGRAACNRYFGTYRQAGDTLEIKPGGSTRMACPPAVMDQETKFLAALEAVRKARREGDKLMLLDDDGRVRMRLTPISRPSAEANVLASAG
jgi:heat shock protein HslJ